MPYCKNCGNQIPEGAAYCPQCGTPVQVAEVKRAYWGERFLAWLIDVIIVSIILGLIRIFTWVAWAGYPLVPGMPSWIPFSGFGTGSIAYFLYWMLSEGIYGQSFGKMFMRLKVTRLDARLPNMAQAAIESVGKAFLLPLDCIIGWLLYPSRRQRLFNRLSDTIVIRT